MTDNLWNEEQRLENEQAMTVPSDQRLNAIAGWAEQRSKNARLESNKRYEADVAAACRAVIAARALADKWRREVKSARSLGARTTADATDICADELCAILGPATGGGDDAE
jgi:hypothetical protein